MTTLRPFPTLLDDAVTAMRRGPISLPLQIGIPLVVVNTGWTAISSWFTSGAYDGADPAMMLGVLGAMVLGLPLLFGVQALVYLTLGAAATLRTLGSPATLPDALRFVFRWRTVGTFMLTTLLLFGSLIALIFPFFVVGALVSFLLPVMIDEKRFGVEAISRSASLAWRNPRGLLQTWPLALIVGIHVVFFAISSGLALAAQAPLQVLQQAVVFREALGGGGDPTALGPVIWLQVPLSVITTFTSVLAAWYLYHCLALFFLDTRERREATSVERAIASWRDAPNAPPSTPPATPPPPPGPPLMPNDASG